MAKKAFPCENIKEVGARIAAARERAGFTQAAVAEMLGIKQQNLSRYESGLVEPSLGLMVVLAKTYNESVDVLLTGEDLVAKGQPVVKMPPIRRFGRPMNLTEPSKNVADALGMAWDVLESGTKTAEALRLNIEEFHEKVQDARPKGGRVNNG